MLFGDMFSANGGAHAPIVVYPGHDVLGELGENYHGVLAFTWHGILGAPFWLMVSGIATAWYLYMGRTDVPAQLAERFSPLYTLLTKKYYFDEIYYAVFAMGSRIIGWALWQIGDVRIIDGLFVNGSAKLVGAVSAVVRHVQSGYLYHYAFGMIIGLLLLLSLVLIG
jgi:NADH-quinone oxidoreductase subunit L